jgi:hypothetical protein
MCVKSVYYITKHAGFKVEIGEHSLTSFFHKEYDRSPMSNSPTPTQPDFQYIITLLQEMKVEIKASEERMIQKINETEERMIVKIGESEQRMIVKIEEVEERMIVKIGESEQRMIVKIEDVKKEMIEKIKESKNGILVEMEIMKHDLSDMLNDRFEQAKDITTDHEYRILRIEHKVGLAV